MNVSYEHNLLSLILFCLSQSVSQGFSSVKSPQVRRSFWYVHKMGRIFFLSLRLSGQFNTFGKPKIPLEPRLHIYLTSDVGWLKLRRYIFNSGLVLYKGECDTRIFRVLSQSYKLGLMANFSWNPILNNKLQTMRVSGAAIAGKNILNKCLSQKLHVVKIHNKVKYAMSNTYVWFVHFGSC